MRLRFCQEHWQALRDAIDERGLGHLVAKDSEEVAKRLRSQAEVGRTVDNYEPLVAAHMAIMQNALEVAGAFLFTGGEDEERCPLCFLNAQHEAHCNTPGCTHNFDNWVGNAADDELEFWAAA